MSGEALTVLIIAVNYGTDEMAVRFVQSAATLLERSNTTVLVVDNTEYDTERGLGQRIQAVDPAARYVRAPRNLGYFGGADYGLDWYLASHRLPDWVLVSNVDVVFRDRQFLVSLRRMESSDDIGVVAPCIRSSRTWRDLNPMLVRRPRRATMKFYKIAFSNGGQLRNPANARPLAMGVASVGREPSQAIRP
jgi:GT2 family glycosyltransferase